MADEYLEGIMNREPKAELAAKSEWLASYNGFIIHENPNLANGWIELRDHEGKIIAHIDNVKQIHIASRQQS